MKINARVCELHLVHPWKIAGRNGSGVSRTIIVELSDGRGLSALGEAAPSELNGETVERVMPFLSRLNPDQFSFEDVPGSLAVLEKIPGLPLAVKCLLDLALLDGAAKRAGQALYDYLGLGFREQRHVTSFSIGLDVPEMVREKVLQAARFPVLKLKVGAPHDRDNLTALRSVAPHKPVRLDANGAWKTKEEALRMIEALAAADQHLQFVEQPMPRNASERDLIWLKARSPLPLFGDEACQTAADIPRCAECFHGVNVKLIKTGGASRARETLLAARAAGLKTMLGCLIETSVQISAAAHLAELTDFLDLDGSLLIRNDPFAGVTMEQGMLSFAAAQEQHGLRVKPRLNPS